MPPGAKGPPLRVHDFDEAFYVLDGELTLQSATSSRPREPASSPLP